MSSAILLYTTAIFKKLAGIFKSSYKEKQTEGSHFEPELSFKNIFNFLLTFLIVSYGFSPPQQKSSGFEKEDKAGVRLGMQPCLPGQPKLSLLFQHRMIFFFYKVKFGPYTQTCLVKQDTDPCSRPQPNAKALWHISIALLPSCRVETECHGDLQLLVDTSPRPRTILISVHHPCVLHV